MIAVTWIPRKTLNELIPQLHTKELHTAALAVDQILHQPDKALPKLIKLWTDHKGALVRYGLNVIREIEVNTSLSKNLLTLRKLLINQLPGQPEFMPPPWWTDELCANHRGFLKYMDIRRTLLRRLKIASADVKGWLAFYNLPPVEKMTTIDVSNANILLDNEKVRVTRPFYTHFEEEPCSDLFFPES